MTRARRDNHADREGAKGKAVTFRPYAQTQAALEAAAEDAGTSVSAFCREVIERYLAGDSSERMRDDLAELTERIDRHDEKIDQLNVAVFETLRTLLVNLTEISEYDLEELRRRVLGR